MKEKLPKQKKHGLKIEKDLRVVKTAGFRAGKKRDKTVNKRAGLHDKSKNLKGEKRVYKCKPLTLVRVRRIKQAVASVSAVAVGIGAYFGMGFLFKPEFIYVEELGNSTVCAADGLTGAGGSSASGVNYVMPADGSLPTEHTVIENVAYMNYVLKNRESWSSYMESSVKTVMEQKVYTHKKFYDGKLISADMPQGASNIARQFCVTDKDVSWREKSKNYIYDDMDNIAWPSEKPTGLSIADFRIYRGLPANEFSVYILNELTVKNWNETSVTEKGEDENGKRLYSMTLDLRVHESGLDSAVHYYKQQMYVTGGLYAWPTFDYTSVKYVFDEDWQVREFTINDKYSAKMGTISADCSSTSTTVFDYAEEKAENTYYKDYFYQTYNKWDPTSSNNEPTAASCLASAFGEVLTEGATLKLELEADGRPLNGAVHLGMKGGAFDELRAVFKGGAVGDIKVYVTDENGKKVLYIALGSNKYCVPLDALGAAASAEGQRTEEGAEAAEGGLALDTNALMEQLFGGKFTLGKNNKTATLESEIELFGLKVPVNFSFNLKKNVATLNEATTSFTLGKTQLAARMTFGTEADVPAELTAAEKTTYVNVFDGITLAADINYGDMAIKGNLFLGFENGGISEVRAAVGGITLGYGFADGTLYINNGEKAKYKLDASALGGGSADLGALLGGIDLNAAITDVLKNFYIGGGTVSSGLQLDLTKQLNQILSLAFAIDFNDGVAVNLESELLGKPLSAEIKLSSQAVPEIGDKSQYTDILNGGIAASAELTVDGVTVNGKIYIELAGGEVKAVRFALDNGVATIYYEKESAFGDYIYVDLGASKIKLPISAISGSGADGLGDLLGNIDIKDILGQIVCNLGGGENKVNSSFVLNVGGEQVPVNFGVGFVEAVTAEAQFNVLGKNVAAKVTLGGDKIPQITDKNKYVNVVSDGFSVSGKLALNVNGVSAELAIKSLAFKLSEGIAFELDARLTADNKYFDVYASFAENNLVLVYGSGDNYVGVKLNTVKDVALLKEALNDAYNRLRAVVGEIAPAYADSLTVENLKNTLNSVLGGKTVADGLTEILNIVGIKTEGGKNPSAADILKALGIPSDENGKIDVKALIASASLTSTGDGIALKIGNNIAVDLGGNANGVDLGASLQFGNAAVSVNLSGVKLSAYNPECPVSEDSLMSADDLADALDYVVAAFELIAEKEVAVNAEAVVDSGAEGLMNVGVTLEYNQGDNGFPVHIDAGKVNPETGLREGVNFWINSTAYLHIGIAVKHTAADAKAAKKDLYVEAYILDANPAGNTAEGITSGKYVADGELDVYVSVSNGGGNPAAIYLPMRDVLTVAAMGGAILNLGDVQLEGEYAAQLNEAIRQIAAVIDELLIKNYLGGISGQFTSLGASMIEQILRAQQIEASNLSELINLLLDSVFGPSLDKLADGETPIAPAISCGNYVKRVVFDRAETERALSVIFNSSAIYGGGYEDLTFRFTKNHYTYGIMPADVEGETVQTVKKSYITGLSIQNLYYGEDNSKKLGLEATVGYSAVKPSANDENAFKGYRNFSDVSTLLAALVNSATHEVENEAELQAAEVETAAPKYELNSEYYIDGKLELGLRIFGKNVGATININNFFVTINKDNTVEINLTISYSKVSLVFFTLIDSTATVDITIKDDMIFMRKTTDGGKTYVTRVMTLEDFSADIMNQLKFALSLSDDIMDMINGGSGGGSGAAINDYGDYLDNYLASYNFTRGNGAATWALAVNRNAINALAGMEVFSENIAVNLNALNFADGSLGIKSIGINSKMFSLLSLNANLEYRNPRNEWDGGNDLRGNVVKLDSKGSYGVDGRSWANILGGTKFADVQKNVNWDKLCRDTSGKSYVEYNGSNLHIGTLKFEYAEDISNAAFAEFGERVTVLYGANVYTSLQRPNLYDYMPPVPNGDDKLVGSWDYNYVVTDESDEYGAVIAIRAKYGAVTATIISPRLVEGGISGFTEYYESAELGYVYYKTFKYDAENKVALEAPANLNTYVFGGYYDYLTGEPVTEFIADKSLTFYADWKGKQINITYTSDLAFGGAAEENGVFTLGGSVRYGANDKLKTPVVEDGANFLGWFLEADGSYVYIADAQALKDYFANTEIVGDSVENATLWAIWTDEIEVNITKSSKSWGTWTIEGNYSGGGYVGAKSAEIGGAAINRRAEVRYELNDNAEHCNDGAQKDALNGGDWFNLGTSSTFGKSRMTTVNGSSYGGARVKVTFTVTTPYGQTDISYNRSAYKQK